MKKIPLTQGKFALVDNSDYTIVIQYKWCALKSGNTYYATNGTVGRMHRFLLSAKEGQIIDHKDRNGLNNQRSNIHFVTAQENYENRTGMRSSSYRGVWFCSWVKSKNKWRATIWQNKSLTHLGMFPTEIEAANKIIESKL